MSRSKMARNGTVWDVNLLRYSIPEAAQILGISRTTLYRRISAGLIGTLYDGGRVFISAAEITRYAQLSHHEVGRA